MGHIKITNRTFVFLMRPEAWEASQRAQITPRAPPGGHRSILDVLFFNRMQKIGTRAAPRR